MSLETVVAVLVALAIGGTAVYVVSYRLADNRDRAGHNDRDYVCRFWWGDRSGSAVGVDKERCRICNPR